MIIGTCHFVDKQAAIRYYSDYPYDDPSKTVERKLREGEIKLGPPRLGRGERRFLNDEGRYCIESKP